MDVVIMDVTIKKKSSVVELPGWPWDLPVSKSFLNQTGIHNLTERSPNTTVC